MSGQSSRYKCLVLGMCFLVNAINICWLMGVMTAVLPSLVTDLALTPVQAGWLMTASTIPGFFAAFLGGIVGDRFGAKWIVGSMAILAGLSSIFRGLFPTFIGVFIGAFLVRMAQGFEWPGLVKTLAH